MTSPPATPAPPRRRRKRWLLVPAALLALVLAAGAVAYARGTWADTRPHDPAGPADGPVAQVYQVPDGGKEVRSAIVLPYPREQVWKVVTDYEHYGDFLPYLADLEVTAADGGCHMKGRAKSALPGWWPFEIDIRQEQTADRWSATWDQPGGPVQVNKGGWVLTPAGAGQTLLVLHLETEARGTPTFLIRNVYLHRLKEVVRAVGRRVQAQASPPA
jgi:ribosome-associated toxin RatA of RatAB toxin-antitoxin module